MKLPKVKVKTDKEIIELLSEELKNKNSIIKKLKEENKLLLKISLKNAKIKIEKKHSK